MRVPFKLTMTSPDQAKRNDTEIEIGRLDERKRLQNSIIAVRLRELRRGRAGEN